MITIRDRRFVDPQGRHVILHGVNVVNKNPAEGYVFDAGPAMFAALRDWGFNVVRLGVIWDGLEPAPAVYDEAYLRRLDQQIAWAKEHGLYIFLDMHQDLYSVLFSDGAPAWATLTDGAPHVDLGGVWSDAYFTSPAVQFALDNFWSNTPAPDGVGLQDHYALMWAHLARRYADEPAVIGYDIMNEPFPGSAGAQAQAAMFARAGELLAPVAPSLGDSVEALMAQWLTAEGRSAMLQLLRDVSLYAQIIDVTESIFTAFEKTQLMALYRRVAQAIRAVDPVTALFLETTMGSNMGVYSGIEPVILDGARDPAQVYAAHGYDLVVDTPDIAAASPERVELIFQRHGATVQRLGMPLLVGEWGAYGRNPGTLPAAWHVVHQFEKLLCSETYWAYEPGMERFPCFQAIQRPYPERVAGTLYSYHYDPETGVFTCTWQEDGQIVAPSRIYLPDWFVFDAANLELTPQGNGTTISPTSPGSANRFLELPPTRTACTRQLIIR
ncbi:MAG TPA: cellulase family glycosylhydrolase [Anaerolineae bacterium]|nr:cellulase family glycosylhydrolase [Anaerolineae bacterium]HQI84872.1 cellulase family glycosylhydrolase [Anaerolineae bacterium]